VDDLFSRTQSRIAHVLNSAGGYLPPQAKIDLQIRIIPADGMNAAVHWNRRTSARPAGGSVRKLYLFLYVGNVTRLL
jgi:hypothetical protein